jgi:tRNA (adenine57-N1/adenine58-N1)-methyltransferase
MKSKVLVRRGKKEYFEDVDKEVTLIKERSFYTTDLSRDFSTDQGIIKKADLKKNGAIKSSKGKDFCVFDGDFVDNYKHLRRLPQMIPLKDIGYIIVQTGIGPNSVVVEGGSGSGGLALQIARYAKKVYSYDIEKEHIALVKESAKALNITNITLKNKDLYKKIDERNVDVICLDVPEPWRAIASADKALKIGGFLVSYSPTIIQSNQFIDTALKKKNLIHLRTTEILDRPWLAEKKRVRPISKEILHSGFITIMRKIS